MISKKGQIFLQKVKIYLLKTKQMFGFKRNDSASVIKRYWQSQYA